MNEKISNLYNKLIKLAGENGLKSRYGIQKLHIGIDCNKISNSILFVGRENRGHGNCIGEKKEKINNEFEKADFNWLKIKSKYPYTKSPFWRVIGKSTSQIINQNGVYKEKLHF